MADITLPKMIIDPVRESQLRRRNEEIEKIEQLKEDARILYLQGNGKAALPLLEQVQQIYEARRPIDYTDAIGITELLVLKGYIYNIQLHDYDKALEQFEKELVIWKQLGDEKGVAIAHRDLAGVYSHRGDFTVAKANLDTAISIQEKLNLSPDLWESYYDLARLMDTTGNSEEADRFFQKSTEVIEGLRGGLVTDETKIGFFQRPVSVYLDYAAFLIKEKKDDSARCRALEMTEKARARALTDSLLRFNGGRTPERTFGEMPSPVQTQSITYQEMIDLASRDNTHYLSYFIAYDSVYAWVISPSGRITYFNLPVTRHELENIVNNFRHLVQKEYIWIDNKDSQNLFAALIAPLQPALDNLKAGDRLTIVPHDLLNSIPFGALLDGAHYWGLIYQLTSVPSLTFAHYLNTLAGSSVDSILAIGKPAGTEKLDNSEWEVTTVLELFPKATKLLGTAANKQEVLTKASEYQSILFSTHGRSESNEFYLELAQGEKLLPGDIQSRDLRKVKVVALSACDTYVGHRYSGDELMSLARAFLVSGVDYVLVTLWPVNDLATSKIVTSFFSRLRAGIAPAAALYQAQQDYFETATNMFKRPFFWAPLVLIGRNA